MAIDVEPTSERWREIVEERNEITQGRMLRRYVYELERQVGSEQSELERLRKENKKLKKDILSLGVVKDAIREASVLMIDGNEMDAAEEAADLASRNGTKVLYDAGGLYEGVERLLKYADILIPSEEFAMGHTGCDNAEDAARKLYELYHPEVVVVTQGKRGGMLFDGEKLITYPIYPADVVDSNGSGDVFHGAFAAAVVKGYDYEKCCHFSSAVSALKCMGVGARESVPDFSTVKKYLKENGYEL